MTTVNMQSDENYIVALDVSFSAKVEDCDWTCDEFQAKFDALLENDPRTKSLGFFRRFDEAEVIEAAKEGTIHYGVHIWTIFRTHPLESVHEIKTYGESLGGKLLEMCPEKSVRVMIMTQAHITSFIRVAEPSDSLTVSTDHQEL